MFHFSRGSLPPEVFLLAKPLRRMLRCVWVCPQSSLARLYRRQAVPGASSGFLHKCFSDSTGETLQSIEDSYNGVVIMAMYFLCMFCPVHFSAPVSVSVWCLHAVSQFERRCLFTLALAAPDFLCDPLSAVHVCRLSCGEGGPQCV